MCYKFLKIWVILLVLWTVNNVSAEDTIVFTNPNEVHNTIQELNKCDELNILNEHKISELSQMIDNQKSFIENCDSKIKELEDIIKNINEFKLEQDKAITNLQELLKTQKDGYEKIIQDSKPTFLQELFEGLGYVGLGLLIGLLI